MKVPAGCTATLEEPPTTGTVATTVLVVVSINETVLVKLLVT